MEYFDYSNIISIKNITELSEHSNINDITIKLKKSKQPLFRLIYNLGSVELEILKIYIKTNLANDFISPFKFPAGAYILFNKKLDRNFYLSVDY